MEHTTNHPAPPVAVFTMGLPGSGKSTTARRVFADVNFSAWIDPDEIKKEKANYNPKQPEVYHEWSSEQAELRFLGALMAGRNFLVDGTGTNSDKMVRRISQAKAHGFRVVLLYVSVTLQTALERNAKRARTVPEYIVREKALDITTSFAIVAEYADEVKVVHND